MDNLKVPLANSTLLTKIWSQSSENMADKLLVVSNDRSRKYLINPWVYFQDTFEDEISRYKTFHNKLSKMMLLAHIPHPRPSLPLHMDMHDRTAMHSSIYFISWRKTNLVIIPWILERRVYRNKMIKYLS